MKDQFQQVDDHFKRDDEAFAEYQKKIEHEFERKEHHLRDHDAEIKHIHKMLSVNEADREELHTICNQLDQKMEEYNLALEKKLNEKFTKLLDK